MSAEEEIDEVKKITKELLQKLYADYFTVIVQLGNPLALDPTPSAVFEVDIELPEPQMFIGQGGQALMSLQRIVGIIAGRRLKKNLYVQLDINNYKKEKMSYLKTMAHQTADEVVTTQIPKTLPPMSSYERRIIHTELAQRTDVATESRGEGDQRSIVVIPRHKG